MVNAQGEDVVAGIRTPQQITLEGSRKWANQQGVDEEIRRTKFPSMEETMPEIYAQLNRFKNKLEQHYHDMQDMEFTVQDGKLWFLQTRNGKRTGTAMVKNCNGLAQGRPNRREDCYSALRAKQNSTNSFTLYSTRRHWHKPECLHVVCQHLQVQQVDKSVFFADDAAKWHEDGHKVIMVRIETSPEDLAGMTAAEGILTARGGMTSHAAVVARGMVNAASVGAGGVVVNYKKRYSRN